MSQPPSPYGAPPPVPPPTGMSNRAKFWLGFALAVPVFIAVQVLFGVVFTALSAVDAPAPVLGVSGVLEAVLLLGALVALVIIQRTRWVALGLLAGAAAVVIVLGGACIVLITALGGLGG